MSVCDLSSFLELLWLVCLLPSPQPSSSSSQSPSLKKSPKPGRHQPVRHLIYSSVEAEKKNIVVWNRVGKTCTERMKARKWDWFTLYLKKAFLGGKSILDIYGAKKRLLDHIYITNLQQTLVKYTLLLIFYSGSRCSKKISKRYQMLIAYNRA